MTTRIRRSILGAVKEFVHKVEIGNLTDVPGFDGLNAVTASHGVDLTVHGGFVRRLAISLRDFDELPDPEELAFFSSDLDVIHSGQTSQTEAIASALIEAVPFGEAIRWQVKSADENVIFDASIPFNGIVPANLMSIGTAQRWGIRDEWRGREDIKARKYRYLQNGFYKRSPLFQAGRDLEIFSALLYFKVLMDDVPFDKTFSKQPGLADAKRVVHSACSSPLMLVSLQDSSYLRARLLYLIKDIRTLAFESEDWKKQVPLFGLDRLAEYLSEPMFRLGEQVSSLLERKDPVVISARLGGDRYRLPDFTESWVLGETGHSQFKITLSVGPSDAARQVSPELAPGQTVIASSPPIPLTPGVSSSSNLGETVHEFFHVAIPLDPQRAAEMSELSDSEFSAFLELAPSPGGKGTPVLTSVPCVCSVGSGYQGGMLFIRINAFGFLENSLELTKCHADQTVAAKAFVVARAPSKLMSFGNEERVELNHTPSQSGVRVDSVADMKVAGTSGGMIVFVHGYCRSASR